MMNETQINKLNIDNTSVFNRRIKKELSTDFKNMKYAFNLNEFKMIVYPHDNNSEPLGIILIFHLNGYPFRRPECQILNDNECPRCAYVIDFNNYGYYALNKHDQSIAFFDGICGVKTKILNNWCPQYKLINVINEITNMLPLVLPFKN